MVDGRIKMVDRLVSKRNKSDLSTDDSEKKVDYESAVFQLEIIHNELDKLTDKETEEILLIEQKYRKLRQHYFVKRNEITDTIPDFWSTVFTSHPSICNMLYDEEEDCLRYLQRLEVETAENIKAGYLIKLYFNENPYFKNDVLIKELCFKSGNLQSISTKIDWKKPNTLGVTNDVDKTIRKRSLKNHCQTFFEWFANNEDATNDIIAEIIKDDIWPNSLHYYLVPDPDTEAHDKEEDSSDTSSSNFDDELFVENDKIQRNNVGECSSTK